MSILDDPLRKDPLDAKQRATVEAMRLASSMFYKTFGQPLSDFDNRLQTAIARVIRDEAVKDDGEELVLLKAILNMAIISILLLDLMDGKITPEQIIQWAGLTDDKPITGMVQ